jgi:hypothetical protein
MKSGSDDSLKTFSPLGGASLGAEPNICGQLKSEARYAKNVDRLPTGSRG